MPELQEITNPKVEVLESSPLKMAEYSNWPRHQIRICNGLVEQAISILNGLVLEGTIQVWEFGEAVQIVTMDMSSNQLAVQVFTPLWEGLQPENGDLKIIARIPQATPIPEDLADLAQIEHEGQIYECVEYVFGCGFSPKYSIMQVMFPVGTKTYDLAEVRFQVQRFKNGAKPEEAGNSVIVNSAEEATKVAFNQRKGEKKLTGVAEGAWHDLERFVESMAAEVWSDEYQYDEDDRYLQRRIPIRTSNPATPPIKDKWGESWFVGQIVLGNGFGYHYSTIEVYFAKDKPMDRAKYEVVTYKNDPYGRIRDREGTFESVEAVIRFCFKQEGSGQKLKGSAFGANNWLKGQIKELQRRWFETKTRQNPVEGLDLDSI